MKFTADHLKRYGAKSCGRVDRDFLIDLVAFAEACPVLSREDLDLILDGISGALGAGI